MASEEMILAPAAGSGIGKLIADELLSRPGFVQQMADTLHDALTATRRTWDKSENNGRGGWHEEPDTRSQLQAFFGILAHMEGEPIKRIIHEHLGTGDRAKPHEILRDSPALVAQLERELAKAKYRASGRNGKKPAVDSSGVTVLEVD